LDAALTKRLITGGGWRGLSALQTSPGEPASS